MNIHDSRIAHTRSRRTPGLAAALTLVMLLAACGYTPPTPAPPDVVAQGEDIFQRTAGGTGCQACHGTDAGGKSGSGPRIVGRPAPAIRAALNRVPQMSHIELTDEEIEAVAAYLWSLRGRD